MYKPDQRHLQPHLFSDLDHLPAKQRQRLEESWAGTYRREFHARLDEQPFAALYSSNASRPNVSVRLLVGFETLKAGFGWSDMEAYDHLLYDMQVRYAVGLDNLGEGHFELRSVYNFRRRVTRHMEKTGINPFARAFAAITDQQIEALALRTKRLRMDSTQVATNIRRMTRLQLLVEILRRVRRMLSEPDRTEYDASLAPYLQGTSRHYVAHLSCEEVTAQMQQVGELVQRLLAELACAYGQHKTYRMLHRVFGEQFTVHDEQVQPKPGAAISASSLRSPDDPDATFRRKAGQEYQGLVANVTETCDPDNPIQLVTAVQVASNTTEDTTLLADALPELKARTAVETLYTDAGFCGPTADQVLDVQQVEQVPTDLRGKDPDPQRLILADFQIERDAQGRPQQVICPRGQTVAVQPGRKPGHYGASFAARGCEACSEQARCPARIRKRDGQRRLRFDQQQMDVAARRRRCTAYRRRRQNLRAAIEAAIGAIKRPYGDKLPVRGKRRAIILLTGSAAMLNVRRIHRYLASQRPTNGPRRDEGAAPTGLTSFLSSLRACLGRTLRCSRPALAFCALSC